MAAPLPRTLRGFIFRANSGPNGPTGLIRDMPGNEYLLTPAHWLDDAPPHVGQIVEFVPRIVDKGRLAEAIEVCTTSSLLTESADETWAELAEEDMKLLKRRQLFYRLNHLVIEQKNSVELALQTVYGVEFPSGYKLDNAPSEDDIKFILNLGPSRSPKATSSTALRLCQALSLDFNRLLGFLRGSLTYRAALEQTRRKNKTASTMDKAAYSETAPKEQATSWTTSVAKALGFGEGDHLKK